MPPTRTSSSSSSDWSLETSPPQPDNDVIVIQGTENPAAETNWASSEPWASNLES
ncbi:hypothetical protein PGTUg99_036058 [Puccinia graminis f. sp. tritici]|uniref:Uncharacterized protein n=1 Tax=Puccinia graminis f. sp. tritici TaxID=56615 RepID=A0A5B0RNH2_PUCGR|nr:hypothetical protein PGTUg99_036058 [Puccinia graminis f. sp. tritici]